MVLYLNFFFSGDFTGPMNYIRATLRGLNDTSRPSPIEQVPVLLVWGTRDGALSQEMAELSRDYVTNFTLQYVEGASHWVQQDEPDVVNEHIDKFVKLST